MTLALDTVLDVDKVIEVVNRSGAAIAPYVSLLGYPEFTIIGPYKEDAEQVHEALKAKLDTRIHVKIMDVREANIIKNLYILFASRCAVLLLDHVCLGTMSIIELESSLVFARNCVTDDGHKISEDDLMINMRGGRFYKR